MWTAIGPNRLPGPICEAFAMREIAVDVPGIRRGVRIRLADSDSEIFRQVFMARDYDRPMPDDVRVVVDAGANVGYASLWFARRFPEARVIAMEPDRANFRQLVANTSGFGRIRCVEAALWSHETVLDLVDTNREGTRLTSMELNTVERGDGRRPVPALSVAALMARMGIDRIDVMKIDVEGSEREIFRDGDRAWIEGVRLVIVETHDFWRPGATDAVLDALPDTRFRRVIDGENQFFYRRD